MEVLIQERGSFSVLGLLLISAGKDEGLWFSGKAGWFWWSGESPGDCGARMCLEIGETCSLRGSYNLVQGDQEQYKAISSHSLLSPHWWN